MAQGFVKNVRFFLQEKHGKESNRFDKDTKMKAQGFVFFCLFFFCSGKIVAKTRFSCALQKKQKSFLCEKYTQLTKAKRFLLVSQFPKQLILCEGMFLLAKYRTGHGRRGFGKKREGDLKTPIGNYHISWMASRHEPRRSRQAEQKVQRYQIRDGKAWCKHNQKTQQSEFNRTQGPKDERLWRKPYGGKWATVMAINYPNEKDLLQGKTGSCIEIHASFHLKSSAGCVLLSPRSVRKIYNCIEPKTPVFLRKKL